MARSSKYTTMLLVGMFLLVGVRWVAGASLVVTSNASSGAGTLRSVIATANGNGEDDLITFSMPSSRITLAPYSGPLTITAKVVIDGGGTTVIDGNQNPVLKFSGSSGGSKVTQLAIVKAWASALGYAYYGIKLETDGNTITGCRFGIDWTGTLEPYQMLVGVYVDGHDNLIGGVNPSDRNWFDDCDDGVLAYYGGERNQVINNRFTACWHGAIDLIQTSDWVIQRNFIGTNDTGMSSAGVSGNGIRLAFVTRTLVGGDRLLGQGNLICNSSNGIELVAADGNSVSGNVIGLNLNQTARLENDRGIDINDAHCNLIGGNFDGGENIISGNQDYGVRDVLSPSGASLFNTFYNNYIGLSRNGVKFGNGIGGIWLNQGTYTTIGGLKDPSFYQRNIISGNGQFEVRVFGSNHQVLGNLIGTNLDGSAAIGTGATRGLVVQGYDHQIGDVAKGNVISGITAGSGIGLDLSDSHAISVCANYIGLNANGSAVISNGVGISLGPVSSVLLGGMAANQRNLICGNGIGLQTLSGAGGNTIVGNWFGVLADGQRAVTSLSKGVSFASNANLLGLRSTGPGNLIAGANTGVECNGNTSNGLFANTICAYTTSGISFLANANLSKAVPVFTFVSAPLIQGTAGANDYVEVFRADRGAGSAGGSLILVGRVTTDPGGSWSLVPSGLSSGQYVCAIATDNGNNSSRFTQNALVWSGTPTVTATVSPTRTVTLTPTPSPTATVSATATGSPTPGPTISPTTTVIPTALGTTRAYPNPAKEQVNFWVSGSIGQTVEITVYNLAGERVGAIKQTLSGTNIVVWDCRKLAPGIYVARVKVNGSEIAKLKVAIMR